MIVRRYLCVFVGHKWKPYLVALNGRDLCENGERWKVCERCNFELLTLPVALRKGGVVPDA